MNLNFKAIAAALPLALISMTGFASAEAWRQACAGPDYVCGKTAAAQKAQAPAPKKLAAKPAAKSVKVAKPATVKAKSVVVAKPMKATKKVAAAAVKPKAKSKVVAKAKPESGSSFQSGVASWYGGNFHGRKTANGETYNMNEMTAAHKTLPFGTRVRVTNTRNGDSVVVRINDRGPFIAGRIIDLSRAAASEIGVTSSGVAPVKVAILGKG